MTNLQQQLNDLDSRTKDVEEKIRPINEQIAQLDEKRAVAQEILDLKDGEEAGLTVRYRNKAAAAVGQVDKEKPALVERLAHWNEVLAKLQQQRKEFPFEALARQKEVERLCRKLDACR